MKCFQKYVQYESNNDVIKHYNAVIPHDWDMWFEKFGGLPNVVAFWENQLPRQGQINSLKYEPQRVRWIAFTPLDVKFLWAQCVKGNYNRMELFAIGEQ